MALNHSIDLFAACVLDTEAMHMQGFLLPSASTVDMTSSARTPARISSPSGLSIKYHRQLT
jgi:hypothetical protein